MERQDFCQTLISATTKKEADKISDTLIKKRLIAGSLVIKGPSRYWWGGKIVEKEYYNIQGFTLLKNKSKIISEVKKIHSDKCPIIAFIKIDGNSEFLKWIKESIG
ncbi:MAG: divalent cation tolerance protein CutA [bacterium]|nr:divalent cation tolerance protein CutA [bacterium]